MDLLCCWSRNNSNCFGLGICLDDKISINCLKIFPFLFFFFNFVRYPEYQEKIYEEIKANIGDRDPAQEDLKNMTFLEMFIKEGTKETMP